MFDLPACVKADERTFICSPLRAASPEGYEANKAFAAALCRAAMKAGWGRAFAPHVFYTAIGLDDTVEAEREAGINAGFKDLAECDRIFWSLPPWASEPSSGMNREFAFADERHIPVHRVELTEAGELIIHPAFLAQCESECNPTMTNPADTVDTAASAPDEDLALGEDILEIEMEDGTTERFIMDDTFVIDDVTYAVLMTVNENGELIPAEDDNAADVLVRLTVDSDNDKLIYVESVTDDDEITKVVEWLLAQDEEDELQDFHAEMTADGKTWDDLRASSDQAAAGQTVTLAEIRQQSIEQSVADQFPMAELVREIAVSGNEIPDGRPTQAGPEDEVKVEWTEEELRLIGKVRPGMPSKLNIMPKSTNQETA